MDKTSQLQTRLDADTKQELRIAAAHRDMKMSEYLRELVGEFLDDDLTDGRTPPDFDAEYPVQGDEQVVTRVDEETRTAFHVASAERDMDMAELLRAVIDAYFVSDTDEGNQQTPTQTVDC